MGIVSNLYKKKFVCRYDKEIGVPYYSYTDFNGLFEESFSFINSIKTEIHYFFYYYENYRTDKLILFCPGIGPGHYAYFAEIDALAKNGYKVLTLDYTGCGDSKGSHLRSLNAPTRDVEDLLKHLHLDIPVVLVGHSLGGYTSLNIINLNNNITKAVIMSGFLDIPSLVNSMIKSKFIASRILKYEQNVEKEYYALDNLSYLSNTKDDILFIQSKDDAVVPYEIALGKLSNISNSHLKTITLEDRKHNPNYSKSAIEYMNKVFVEYNYLLKKKKIKADSEKIEFFKDKSIQKMTEQDEKIIKSIVSFIN